MSGRGAVVSEVGEEGAGAAAASIGAHEEEASRRGLEELPESDASPRVAFQGEPGAFSEEAVISYFGIEAEAVPRRDFAAVGAAVTEGDCDYGLLPVENSVAGSVTGAYDVLATGTLTVIGEVVRPIRHCLLGVAGARLEDVRRALSHPMALAQCTRFFRAHPGITPVAVYDTAGAAKEVAAAGDRTAAAVAGGRAAELFGLDILAEDVQDRADNQTRFYVVSSRAAARATSSEHAAHRPSEQRRAGAGRTPSRGAGAEARRKTVLIAETPNRPGALRALLAPFADAGVNLTKLEARPGREPWTYRFFLELDGSAGVMAIDDAVAAAHACTASLVVLGSF